MAKIYHNCFFKYHDFITILCHVGLTILSEHLQSNSFPSYKDKAFQGNKILKRMVDI